MAEEEAKETKKEKKKFNKEDFLNTATKRLKREIDADTHNRTAAIEDLKFLQGGDNQWDDGEIKRRNLRGRPHLTMNELPKYVNQLVGDMRHNRARIKVRPASAKADPDIACVRQGIIWDAEYTSNAEAIYDYAGEMVASCGYGAWRIRTRYCLDNPFLQEMYLERIKNPFLVYYDSDAKSEVYADAKYCFVLEKLTRDEFKERYPGKDTPSTSLKTGFGTSDEVWFDSDTFFIADYYVVETEKQTMCQLADGSFLDEESLNERIEAWEKDVQEKRSKLEEQRQQLIEITSQQPPPPPLLSGAPSPQPPPPPPPLPPKPDLPDNLKAERKREVERPRVRHYAITADQILDGPNDIPGFFIPVILAQGPDRNIEGKRWVRSLIRDAKDPQRNLNFWVTDAAEIVDMIPKAPWIGTAVQFAGYEKDYAAANVENFPFLKYNRDVDDMGREAPLPQRVDIGQQPVAIFSQITMAIQGIKDAIGMYSADVGDQGPERTGAALMQRQMPGDIATFCFIDNLNRAIAHGGRIMNSMIPEVYDTDRDVRVYNMDDTQSFMPVNTTVAKAQERTGMIPQPAQLPGQPNQQPGQMPIKDQFKNMDKRLIQRLKVQNRNDKYNDLSEGIYDIEIRTGPSYATQRQEASTQLIQIAQFNPEVFKMVAHIYFRNADFDGAEEASEILKATLPPGLIKPQPGEPPPPPREPAPMEQVQMILAQAAQKEAQVKELDAQNKQLEAQNNKLKIANEAEKIKVSKIKTMNELSQTKGEMRKLILDTLSEVFEPGPPGQQPQRGV